MNPAAKASRTRMLRDGSRDIETRNAPVLKTAVSYHESFKKCTHRDEMGRIYISLEDNVYQVVLPRSTRLIPQQGETVKLTGMQPRRIREVCQQTKTIYVVGF